MTPSPTIKLLLDESYCLHLIRERPRHLLPAFERFQPGEIGVSSITVAGLQARADQSQAPAHNRRALDQFLLPLAVVDFDAAAAAMLGPVSANLSPQDAPADSHRLLLAAHALSLDAILVTAEPERYAAIPELRVNQGVAAPLVEPPAPPATPAVPAPKPAGTILAFGSHDVTLELLGDELHSRHPGLTLISAHVGSLGGLLALQQGQAHLAGAHLFDAESGEYNAPYIRRLLTPHGIRVALVGFVTRVQGLIVKRDNPNNIQGLADLLREDVRFVNRQRGAGTRVLLDYHLSQQAIDPARIQGYAREESSHLAVAAAVASGVADCGLGIQAMARSHNLGFIPLFHERYDLVIPTAQMESDLLAPFLALLRNPPASFLREVAALGGYGVEKMGVVLEEI
jgi:molybdate-binding protein/predicted nucleic acid-binding protein